MAGEKEEGVTAEGSESKGRRWLLPVAGLFLVVTTAALLFAAPINAPAQAKAALARLEKDEAAVRTGRFSVVTTRYRAELPSPTPFAEAREAALKTAPEARTQETLLFSNADWRREITITDNHGAPQDRITLVMYGGVGRALQQTGHGERAQRIGTVGEDLATGADPVALLLKSRFASALKDVAWSSYKQTGGQLVLTGKRSDQQLTLKLRTQPRYAVEHVAIVEKRVTPVGEVDHRQQVSATWDPAGKGGMTLKTLEFVDYVKGGVNGAAVTSLKLEGAMINNPIRPDEIELTFPVGTRVADRRVEPAVVYRAADKEPTMVELQAMADRLAATLATVGKPAPQWELKGLDGKTAKLSDYAGKVVLITWFASWCGPCNTEAPELEKDVWQRYRNRGLQVLGINCGEEGDPEPIAREFVKTHGVTYPVFLDTDDDTVRKYTADKLPRNAVIDKKGVVQFLGNGFDKETITKKVEELLGK